MQRLADRVAIVTGGAQGIGGACARRLAGEGARVLVVDNDPLTASKNVEKIRSAGGTAEAMEADVGSEAAVHAMIERAVELWGKLDIVVNNAYSNVLAARVDAVQTTEDAWDLGMDVGLKAMFRAAKYAVPHFRKAGGGAMVNMASVHGLAAEPGVLVYETVKAGVIQLTRQLAVEYGPENIRVNAICPGHIVTERLQDQWRGHQETLRFFEQQYPLRRTGVPDDIGNAVVFLCSDESSFITGQALVVDGGLTIQLAESLTLRLARYAQEHPLTYFPY